MSVKYEHFNEQLLDEYVHLFLNVFSKEPWNDKWQSIESAKAYIKDIMNTPGFRGYVALRGKQVIGVIVGHIIKWWQGDEYFIKEFYVDSSKQGEGVGTQLTHYMNENLKDEDVKNVVLLTEDNIPAYKFYKKCGFERKNHTVFMVNSID